ncbi:MAG: hypothetical protein ACXWHC_02215 [Usitatibacter sp.]
MNDIDGIPYVEAQFDKDGNLPLPFDLPGGATDVIVISHGWNNSPELARNLYRDFFTSFAAVARPGELPGRSIAIVGVIWPSKAFDEMVAISGAPGGAGGSASLGGYDAAGRDALERKLDSMKDFFTEPAQQKALDAARALIPDLEGKGSARREFVNRIRSLVDPAAASRDDASTTFFKDDGDAIMQNLKVDADDLDEEIAAPGGGAAMSGGVATAARATQGAAGLTETISGFKAAAMNILNYTTYYEMKARAGTVGKNGVAKLIDSFPAQVQRIHLVGHSFGGRVVASTAANSTTDKIASMTLLQAAFSHNGFSKTMNGAFRPVADQGRIHGPILVTHTKNDTAVGILYPLASRINGDRTAAFGDENDVFGGIGRNGTQKMQSGEATFGKLLAADGGYAFQPGRFFNLEASDFIKEHSDVTGKEVAHAVRAAIAG